LTLAQVQQNHIVLTTLLFRTVSILSKCCGSRRGEEHNSTVAYFLISFAVILFGELSRRTIAKQRGVQARLLTIQEELEERILRRTVLLEVTNESLRDLSAQLLRARDEEQRKLARRLHDRTGQTLGALVINLARLEREPSNSAQASLSGHRKARRWLEKSPTACVPFLTFFTPLC
jgi:signal transduction histidine kinase